MDREAVQERFGIIGASPGVRKVVDRIRLVAPTDISVLITGESGVGKELVAQAIHALSPRRHKDMVIVNAGAIPEGLIESELFGAEKGSYTGAVARRTGVFEDADGSSIFLDEVGEMPANAQVRLLRVLESGQFSRVGSSTLQTVDVRVIAATNKDLAEQVRARRFREDLYYRLSTVQIHLPPLRERTEDILPIFDHFTLRFARQYNARIRALDADARALMTRYSWPGNIRELRNVAEQVVVLLRGETVSAEDLRPLLRGVSAGSSNQLVPIGDAADPDTRERELMYRLLIELHQDMRDLKQVVNVLAARARSDSDEPLPFDPNAFSVVNEGGYRDGRNLPVPREADETDAPWYIEDAPFEFEDDEPEAIDVEPEPFVDAISSSDADVSADATLPTIAEAERTLIARALERFEGNRRRTAEALDISERTLYRKIKEMESEDTASS